MLQPIVKFKLLFDRTNAFNIFSENSMERDKFLSPVEAKEFGILDKILDHPPNFNIDGNSDVESEPASDPVNKDTTTT